MSTTLTPFQQEAQLAIEKANALGFSFDFDNKLSKVTWGYTDNVNSTLVRSIDYKLLRSGTVWIIQAFTTYNFVTNVENGIHLENILQQDWKQTTVKEHFVCSIVL